MLFRLLATIPSFAAALLLACTHDDGDEPSATAQESPCAVVAETSGTVHQVWLLPAGQGLTAAWLEYDSSSGLFSDLSVTLAFAPIDEDGAIGPTTKRLLATDSPFLIGVPNSVASVGEQLVVALGDRYAVATISEDPSVQVRAWEPGSGIDMVPLDDSRLAILTVGGPDSGHAVRFRLLDVPTGDISADVEYDGLAFDPGAESPVHQALGQSIRLVKLPDERFLAMGIEPGGALRGLVIDAEGTVHSGPKDLVEARTDKRLTVPRAVTLPSGDVGVFWTNGEELGATVTSADLGTTTQNLSFGNESDLAIVAALSDAEGIRLGTLSVYGGLSVRRLDWDNGQFQVLDEELSPSTGCSLPSGRTRPALAAGPDGTIVSWADQGQIHTRRLPP